MKRRNFIAAIGAATAMPLTLRTQERARRIGVLMATGNDAEGQARLAAFREELKKLGWAEGRNILIDTRWAAVDMEAGSYHSPNTARPRR